MKKEPRTPGFYVTLTIVVAIFVAVLTLFVLLFVNEPALYHCGTEGCLFPLRPH